MGLFSSVARAFLINVYISFFSYIKVNLHVNRSVFIYMGVFASMAKALYRIVFKKKIRAHRSLYTICEFIYVYACIYMYIYI